ncbi:MAG: Crp/Fnr family transcriptional regulator [Bacteroidia bacterium]|nr:Crp/Fnr family transcriptional regulator [Bacteroidia bacterium]
MDATLPTILETAPEALREEFRRHAIAKSVPGGVELSAEGTACHFFPLVSSGVVRVFKLSRDGGELTLYRIREGEGCILTMTCLLHGTDFPANAYTEQPSVVWLVPAAVFKDWMVRFEFWRQYVIGFLSGTIRKLIGLVDHMVFRSVESRIVDVLLQNTSADQPVLAATHQRIAYDAGTAREVVSRHLKEFETRGWLTLNRGAVTILDRPSLARLTELL